MSNRVLLAALSAAFCFVAVGVFAEDAPSAESDCLTAASGDEHVLYDCTLAEPDTAATEASQTANATTNFQGDAGSAPVSEGELAAEEAPLDNDFMLDDFSFDLGFGLDEAADEDRELADIVVVERSKFGASLTGSITPLVLMNIQTDDDGLAETEPIENIFGLYNLFTAVSADFTWELAEPLFLGVTGTANVIQQIFENLDTMENYASAINGSVDVSLDWFATPILRLGLSTGFIANYGLQPISDSERILIQAATLLTDGPATIESNMAVMGGANAGLSLADGRVNLVASYGLRINFIDRQAYLERGQLGDYRRDFDHQIGVAGYLESNIGTIRNITGVYIGYRIWDSNYVFGRNTGYDAGLRSQFIFGQKFSAQAGLTYAYRRYFHRKNSYRSNVGIDASATWTPKEGLSLVFAGNVSFLDAMNMTPLGEYVVLPDNTEIYSSVGLVSMNLSIGVSFTPAFDIADAEPVWVSDTAPVGPAGGVDLGAGGGSCVGGVCTF